MTQYINNELESVIYRRIPNFPNYEICSTGQILNLKSLRLLTPTIKDTGYYAVHLIKKENDKSIRKNCYIHRLLGECFLENPDSKPIIDHINRNRTDNRLSNLRYATYSENSSNSSPRKNKKNNLSKNIMDYGSRFRLVIIQRGMRIIDKSYLKKNYCLEMVKGIRNDLLTKNNIPIVD